MIIPIRNQPITFAPIETENGSCGVISEYCQLAQLNDRLCFQLRQSSCLPQLLCNNDFSLFLENLVDPYGDFDSEVEFDAWASDHLTWYWDEYGRRACVFTNVDGDPDHFGGLLRFNLPYGLSDDCTYVITFTVSGWTAPDGDVSDADLTVTLPDGTTQVVTQNGTYSFPSGAGSYFEFDPGLNWVGCVDTVTLTCGGSCWDFDFPLPEKNPVSLGGNGLCKVLDYETTVTEQAESLTVGKYYQLIVDVQNMTTGSVEFFLGTVSIGIITENGIFTMSGIADDVKFKFVMSEFFDGCVMKIDLNLLSHDYTLKLKNSKDDTTIVDLSTRLVYKNDLIYACVNFDETMLGFLIPNFVKNSVCMYLEIESPADGDVVTTGDFTFGNSNSILDDWGFSGTLTYEAVQGQVSLTGGTGYFVQDLSGGGFVQGNTYYVAFDLTCLDHGESDPDFDSFTCSLGSASDGSGGAMVWDSTDFPTESGHYIFKVIAGSDGDFIAFYFDDSNGLSKVCIDNIVVRDTPCAKELLQSNCIKYANENEGVPGWGDSKIITACNEEGESMGFDWSTGFKLQSRLYCHIISPHYPTKEDSTYLQSDGERKRIYADSSKVMELIFDEVDELTHDFIRTMLKCDNLWIEDGYELKNRYISLDTDYVPEWDKKGLRSLAESRTDVQKIDNTIFNTNCR